MVEQSRFARAVTKWDPAERGAEMTHAAHLLTRPVAEATVYLVSWQSHRVRIDVRCAVRWWGHGTAVCVLVVVLSMNVKFAAKGKPPWGQVFGRRRPSGW